MWVQGASDIDIGDDGGAAWLNVHADASHLPYRKFPPPDGGGIKPLKPPPAPPLAHATIVDEQYQTSF
jgi:hypothetical protein